MSSFRKLAIKLQCKYSIEKEANQLLLLMMLQLGCWTNCNWPLQFSFYVAQWSCQMQGRKLNKSQGERTAWTLLMTQTAGGRRQAAVATAICYMRGRGQGNGVNCLGIKIAVTTEAAEALQGSTTSLGTERQGSNMGAGCKVWSVPSVRLNLYLYINPASSRSVCVCPNVRVASEMCRKDFYCIFMAHTQQQHQQH